MNTNSLFIINTSVILTAINTMERTLATVNINMGLGSQNPYLLITRSTNVPQLVKQFIQIYKLPHSAFDVIIESIEHELAKQNICVESLGRMSFGKEERVGIKIKKQEKENIPLVEIKQRKQQGLLAENRARKQNIPIPINRIEFQRKMTSPVCRDRDRKYEMNRHKIQIVRNKTPLMKHDKSPCETKRSKSPIQIRTPQRQKHRIQFSRTTNIDKPHPFSHHINSQSCCQFQVLSQTFDTLTRHQPKSIKVLSPQFVTFTGIRPKVLAALQDFFQQIEEHEFMNMDKMYFVARMKQLNLTKKLIQAMEY